MKYIIIIAVTSLLGAISLVEKVSEPHIQASIPVEFIDFTTPVVIEVSSSPDPATLYIETSDAGIFTHP